MRGFTPGCEAMSHAVVRIHERGSFGSIFASALILTNPTMNNRGNWSIYWSSLEHLEKVSSQQSCWKSSSSSSGETCQSSINQQAYELSIYTTIINEGLTSGVLLSATSLSPYFMAYRAQYRPLSGITYGVWNKLFLWLAMFVGRRVSVGLSPCSVSVSTVLFRIEEFTTKVEYLFKRIWAHGTRIV